MVNELKVNIEERDCGDDGKSLHGDETEEAFLNRMLALGWVCTVIRETKGCNYNNRFYYFYPKTVFQL